MWINIRYCFRKKKCRSGGSEQENTEKEIQREQRREIPQVGCSSQRKGKSKGVKKKKILIII